MRGATSAAKRPSTLAIDIGGTGVKASVLDDHGRMIAERLRVKTPKHLTPGALVILIEVLVRSLPPFNRVSVGFPGVVRHGVILTAPNLSTARFRGFNLASALERRLRVPVRVGNDADVQGLGVIRGRGVELVITLGTGFGSAIFQDGSLGPHLKLAHHCFHNGYTYEDLLGDPARKKDLRKWSRHVLKAIDTLRNLTTFDHLYIGGGNAHRLKLKAVARSDVTVVDNTAGILGGIRLWDPLGSSTGASASGPPPRRHPS